MKYLVLIRIALIAVSALLFGCAAMAPKEPLRLGEIPKISTEIVKLQDARKGIQSSNEKLQMLSGEGARIPDAMINPEALQVFAAYLNEYMVEKSIAPLTTTFQVVRLDVAVLKGKAPPVAPSPGAEGYMGYVGAALGKMMAQAVADAGIPNYVEAAVDLESGTRKIQCGGRSSIDKDQTAAATLIALKNSGYSCGFHLLP